MIGALGTIPYAGIGFTDLRILQRPDVRINRSIDGSTYSVQVINAGVKAYEVWRASGTLELYEIIATTSAATFDDVVPNPAVNYSYIIKWSQVSSPFVAVSSGPVYAVQKQNIV